MGSPLNRMCARLGTLIASAGIEACRIRLQTCSRSVHNEPLAFHFPRQNSGRYPKNWRTEIAADLPRTPRLVELPVSISHFRAVQQSNNQHPAAAQRCAIEPGSNSRLVCTLIPSRRTTCFSLSLRCSERSQRHTHCSENSDREENSCDRSNNRRN
jgi:hypothetical protein